MIFQNPDKFVTGEIHSYRLEWEPILEGIFKKALEINPFVYHSDGVRVAELLVPFKGDFEGKFYNCPIPLCAVFHSSKLCENFEEFFTAIILDRGRSSAPGHTHALPSSPCTKPRISTTMSVSYISGSEISRCFWIIFQSATICA